MNEMKEIILKSGRKLKISLAPWKDARELYQAVASELIAVKADPKQELDTNFIKDLFCTMLASKKIEAALWLCMKRCLYNGERIQEETFEPAEAREDYLDICAEVAKENINPFAKSLYAEYGPLFQGLTSVLK